MNSKKQEENTGVMITPAVMDKHFEGSKTSLDAYKNKILAITVIEDDKTCEEVKDMQLKLNNHLKDIETVRTTLKAPYIATGKAIDKRAKEIADSTKTAFDHGKKLLLDYNKVIEQRQKEAQQKAEKIQKEAQRKSQEIEAKSLELQKNLNTRAMNAFDAIKNAKRSELGKISDEHFKAFPLAEFKTELHNTVIDYSEPAAELKKHILAAGKLRHLQLKQEVEKHPDAKKTALQFSGYYDDMKGIYGEGGVNESIEKVHEVVSDDAQLTSEMTSAEATSEVLTLQNNSAKVITQKRWDFNVQKIEDVPFEMLMLDATKVRDYITQNKEELEKQWDEIEKNNGSGFVHKGIYFFKNTSVVTR